VICMLHKSPLDPLGLTRQEQGKAGQDHGIQILRHWRRVDWNTAFQQLERAWPRRDFPILAWN